MKSDSRDCTPPTAQPSVDAKSEPYRRLDDELRFRLDATLSAECKLELAGATALTDDESAEDEESSELSRETSAAFEFEAPESGDVPSRDVIDCPPDAKPRDRDDQTAEAMDRDNGEQTKAGQSEALADGESHTVEKEVLARIEFGDGDALLFEAIPADGEIGVAYRGENPHRAVAVLSSLASPVRLFASLAPADVPFPWLLPAVDQPPDRDELLGNRPLCDRLEEPIRATSNVLRLRVPGAPDHWWTPGDMAIGGYCGWNGQQEFKAAFCDPQWESGSTSIAFSNIFKCHSQLNSSILHESKDLFNHWRRRRRSDALCAACGSPVRIIHQYRALGTFQWVWKTARNDVVGPANLIGTPWQGLVMRRRRIRYLRWGGIGGLRAFSRFTQAYVKVP